MKTVSIEIREDDLKSLFKGVITEATIKEVAESAIKELQEKRWSWGELEGLSPLSNAIVASAMSRVFQDYERDRDFMDSLAEKLSQRVTDEQLKSIIIELLMKNKK